MPTTSRLNLPYPQGTDIADVPSDVAALANAVSAAAAAWATGTESARPAASIAGRWYLATDSGVLYLDTGTAWLRMGPPELATPAGMIGFTAASTPPAGWLVRDGAAVSRTTYAALFAAIGTTWGPGDGSTTFNLPDARGRVDMGSGAGPGLTARTIGQKPGGESLPAHEHSIPAHQHSAGSLAADYIGAHSHHTVDTNNLAQAAAQLAESGSASTKFFWVYSSAGTPNTGNSGAHGHTISGQTSPAGDGTTGSIGSGIHGVIQPSGVYLPIIKT